jgi:hypothetical protein
MIIALDFPEWMEFMPPASKIVSRPAGIPRLPEDRVAKK